MSSINQLISEVAHAVQQADSIPVRRAIKLGIIHARNEAIHRSYSNHNVTDKVLQQRFKLSLINVPDGDFPETKDLNLNIVKRTNSKVPRPTRLNTGVPFHSIRTSGVKNPIEIAYVKEASSKFYAAVPGMKCIPTYDYINDYIYIDINKSPSFNSIGAIVIESVFEMPHIINVDNSTDSINFSDDDEFFLPEDMINTVKKLFFETFNINVIRQTNEVPTANLIK